MVDMSVVQDAQGKGYCPRSFDTSVDPFRLPTDGPKARAMAIEEQPRRRAFGEPSLATLKRKEADRRDPEISDVGERPDPGNVPRGKVPPVEETTLRTTKIWSPS